MNKDLYKGRAYAPLLEKNRSLVVVIISVVSRHAISVVTSITTVIDFKRNKDGIQRGEQIEYDPNRTAHIALLLFADGERRTWHQKASQLVTLLSCAAAPIKAGNCLIRNIPVGAVIHAIELKPGKARSCATGARSR